MISLIFHVLLGYTWMFIASHIITLIKEVFRPGIFISTHGLSVEGDPVEEILSVSLGRLCLYSLMAFSAYSFTIICTVLPQRYILRNMKINFVFRGLPKIIAFYRICFYVHESRSVFYDILKMSIKYSSLFFTKILSLDNYFFGTSVKKVDRRRVQWCPNRDGKFDPRNRKMRNPGCFTDDDFVKYFNVPRNEKRKFMLFYVPKYFAFLAVIFVVLVILTIQINFSIFLYLSYRLGKALEETYCSIENLVSENHRKGEFLEVFFVLSLGIILHALRCLSSLSLNIYRRDHQSMIHGVSRLVKVVIHNFYTKVVWPIIIGFHVKMLADNILHDDENVRIIFVSKVFVIGTFFSSFLLLFFNILGVVHSGMIETSSIKAYFKRMVLITNLLGLIALTPYVSDVIARKFITIAYRRILYVLFTFLPSASPIIVYSGIYGFGRISEFIRGLRDDFYLVERRLVNYDGEGD
jgi:hypothetical protein